MKEKTYSNIYKDNWTQPWPMSSEIYLKVHENPRAFLSNSSPILLESLAHGSSDWSLPRKDCISNILLPFIIKLVSFFLLYLVEINNSAAREGRKCTIINTTAGGFAGEGSTKSTRKRQCI